MTDCILLQLEMHSQNTHVSSEDLAIAMHIRCTTVCLLPAARLGVLCEVFHLLPTACSIPPKNSVLRGYSSTIA